METPKEQNGNQEYENLNMHTKRWREGNKIRFKITQKTKHVSKDSGEKKWYRTTIIAIEIGTNLEILLEKMYANL